MSKTKKKNIEELLKDLLVTEEENAKIQENWIWIRLGDVCNFKRGPFGSAIKKSMFVPKEKDTYKVYEQGNAIRKTIDYGNYYISREDFENLKGFEVNAGDILVSCAGTIGETYVIPPNYERGVINQALMKVSISRALDKKYFLYAFDFYIKQLAKNNAKGTAIKNLPPLKELKQYVIPLPPLSEQKRIVEKAERLLNKIEEARLLTEEAKETFELRRESILDKAFGGELTRKWREEKNKINSMPKLPFASAEAPYSLPQSWIWITLEDGCEKITDGTHHSPKSYPTGDYMYITAKNIKEKGILLDNVTYVSKEVHEEIYSRCDVKKGDVLYIKDGATTGIATVNQLSEEFSLLSSVGLLRPKKDVLLPEYLMFCLNSLTTKRRMLSMMSGNAIRRLTLKKIKQGIIPLPPIDEQHVIVSILDKVKNIDEKLNWYSNVDQDIESLKQSILSKAFRGELGTNDSSEENAIELLKEILQEQVK